MGRSGQGLGSGTGVDARFPAGSSRSRGGAPLHRCVAPQFAPAGPRQRRCRLAPRIEALSPLRDELPEVAFTVGGARVISASIRLRVGPAVLDPSPSPPLTRCLRPSIHSAYETS